MDIYSKPYYINSNQILFQVLFVPTTNQSISSHRRAVACRYIIPEYQQSASDSKSTQICICRYACITNITFNIIGLHHLYITMYTYLNNSVAHPIQIHSNMHMAICMLNITFNVIGLHHLFIIH